MATAKQIAIEVVQSLPEDCTLEDAAYRLYLRQLIEAGRQDVREAGFSPKKKSSARRRCGSSRKVVAIAFP